MPGLKAIFAVGGTSLLGVSCYCYFSGSPWFFQHVAMPISRMLDPEKAHRTSVFLASHRLIPKAKQKDPDILVRIQDTLNSISQLTVRYFQN